jgi:hypothetical protein
VRKKITVQRSGGDLIVSVDDGSSSIKTHTLHGDHRDAFRVMLLGEGCSERHITEALEVRKTEKTTIIMATAER